MATKKKVIKNFLTQKQSDILSKKKWTVNKKGFMLTLYKYEFDTEVWFEMCSTAKVPEDTYSFNVLSFATSID